MQAGAIEAEAAASWREFYQDGRKYVRSSRGGITRPDIFTPEISFNLAAMAIEKLAMAMLLAVGDIADNHTMSDLVMALGRLPDVDLDILERIQQLGRFEDLCPFTPPQHDEVSADDLPAIITLAEDLLAAAERQLPLA